MLHMVVMTHGPETCPAGRPEMQEKCGSRIVAFNEGSVHHDVQVRGFWSNPTEHVFWVLAEAPHAHAVNDLVSDLELFHWNTVEVHPVVEIEAHPLVHSA
jgi:muconolactone delta-isomerase